MAENKMEQVAAMNNFDKLLGRNGELVELRKEQVLAGAMHIIQQYYADKQNKMEAVAKLFGKKLGEELIVKHTKQDGEYRAKLDRKGAWYWWANGNPEYNGWHYSETLLVHLLTGQVVIVSD